MNYRYDFSDLFILNHSLKKVVGYVPPIATGKSGKSNILLLQKTFYFFKKHFTSSKNKAKEIGCKKITKIKRGVGYRRKDVV